MHPTGKDWLSDWLRFLILEGRRRGVFDIALYWLHPGLHLCMAEPFIRVPFGLQRYRNTMGDYLKTIDYIIFVLLMIGGIWGAIKGFIEEVSSKFGYVLGFLLGAMFTKALSSVFVQQMAFPRWFASFIAFFLIFMAGYSVMKGVGTALGGICETANIAVIDNLLGFALGVVESILVIGILEMLLKYQNLVDLGPTLEESFFSSRLIVPMVEWFKTAVEGIV